MNAQLDALLAALVRARESSPAELVSSLQSLPKPDVLPSPWDTWTLIGLARHRKRQLWVAEIIRTRLRGAPAELAAMGALGHPEPVPQTGPVPGMPEWEYFFHGRGCCISHKVDGDAIDVDFWDDSAEYFDTFFYTNYLESLGRPEPPEQRLRELYPSACAVTIAVRDLLAAGALAPQRDGDTHPYRLADQVLAAVDDIDSFCNVWSQSDRRLWLAALIGDWPAADEAAAGRPDLREITRRRSECCRELRWQRLRGELGDQHRGPDALQALADLRSPDLDQHLEKALSGPPSALATAALAVIGQQDDPRWCTLVNGLFSRVNPAGKMPEPHLWMTSLKFLLRHGYRTGEVIASLPKAGGTEIGEAVLLSLEYAPELALLLIRKALLTSVPMDRTQVAAILALINTPWSRRELLRVLNASGDQEKTADVRAALLECGDEEAERTVLAWEERNPHENEIGSYLEIDGRRRGPFYSLSEISLKNCAARMRYEMDQLRDVVANVKNVVPPEPRRVRPWWKFWG